MAPYLQAAAGNLTDALRLYHWNIEMSGATYEALHTFEVVLRNAMDEQLCRWNTTQVDRASGRQHGSDWLSDPSHLLRRLTRDDISKAIERAQRALQIRRGVGRTLTHGDVVAQLNLGTWRFLLPDRDSGRQRLWADSLSATFPHLAGTPAELVTNVDHIYKLRNRVAHLEPLLISPTLETRFRQVRAVLAAISPDVEGWFVSRQRMTSVIRSRPF